MPGRLEVRGGGAAFWARADALGTTAMPIAAAAIRRAILALSCTSGLILAGLNLARWLSALASGP
jgi:hypothetical protein